MNKIKTVSAVALKGKVSNQTATETEPVTDNKVKVVGSHSEFPEIDKIEDTFSIKVKDDEGKIVYENESETFTYYRVPSLASALKFYGAKLSDDQMQFLAEALKGSKETGEAVSALQDVVNADLKASAKASAYSSKYNEKKPVTEEQIGNAHASILRNYLKTNPGVSDETALKTLQQFNIIPAEFTLDDYRGNKGKR